MGLNEVFEWNGKGWYASTRIGDTVYTERIASPSAIRDEADRRARMSGYGTPALYLSPPPTQEGVTIIIHK